MTPTGVFGRLRDGLDGDYGGAPIEEKVLCSMPISFRTSKHDLAISRHDIQSCLRGEFNIDRIDKIFDWLWLVGRPTPPRPLHHQLALNRQIVVTEKMELHLVWTTGRMYFKPIPAYLVDGRFLTQYLACRPDCGCQESKTTGQPWRTDVERCNEAELRCRALGFLFSYAALIPHKSDFRIAREKGLLPVESDSPGGPLTWQRWTQLVQQLNEEYKFDCGHVRDDPEDGTNKCADSARIYHYIHRRFVYGELRLKRLNKIYLFLHPPFLQGYMSQWNEYSTFFNDNLAWLASIVVYIALVLNAMQVGLGTDKLKDDGRFGAASFGFTVFAIIGPLFGIFFVLLAAICLFVDNFYKTLHFRKRRFNHVWPEKALLSKG